MVDRRRPTSQLPVQPQKSARVGWRLDAAKNAML
jgi:hypothetical protein